MMTKNSSKWIPGHPHWYEDLPKGGASAGVPKLVHDDVNAMNDVYLELSRTSTLMRGVGLLFSALGFSFLVFALYMYSGFFPLESDVIIPFILCSLMMVGFSWAIIYLARVDLNISQDRPVRFNRISQKVYVYEHNSHWNIFSRYPVSIKVFDWDTLHAEIHRQAGYSGKAYIQRFSLWLVSCKQGTNEVVDRFELKGNMPTTAELYNTWAYCQAYMKCGINEVPQYVPRPQGISFRRSLFEHIRFLDPTEEGRKVRSRMSIWDWLVNIPIFVAGFWLFIPSGIGHYIAMRVAPEVRWPMEIDAESRGNRKVGMVADS